MTDHDILIELRAVKAAVRALPKRIAAAVREELIASSEPETPEAPEPNAECQHPIDKRVDLGEGEWQCGIRTCRFHFVPEGVTA